MDEFDAILGGSETIRTFRKPFTTKRYEEYGNLTSAQFLVMWQNADTVRAFHECGGRFTDQRDSNNRTAGEALQELLKVVAQDLPDKLQEVVEVWDAYVEAVRLQGGLDHVDEATRGFGGRTVPSH